MRVCRGCMEKFIASTSNEFYLTTQIIEDQGGEDNIKTPQPQIKFIYLYSECLLDISGN